MRPLGWCWRLVATALGFLCFGIVGSLYGLVVLPAIRITAGSPTVRSRRCRRLIRLSFRTFIRYMQLSGVLRSEVRDCQRLEDTAGKLVIANHPTLIDVVFLVAFIPDAYCVVKEWVWNSPFLGPMVRAAGYIHSREPDELIAAASDRLRRGGTVVAFPEGTRSEPGRRRRFRRGAANIVVRAHAPALLVYLQATPPTLTKSNPWYHIPPRRFLYLMDVRDIVDAQQFVVAGDSERHNAQRGTAEFERLFRKYESEAGADTGGGGRDGAMAGLE